MLEIPWKDEWFRCSPKYWFLKENQRKFLEQLRAAKNILQNSQWGNLTIDEVIENGGSGLLNQYGGSIFHALKENYPG